jgi:serine/threonine protein kinase
VRSPDTSRDSSNEDEDEEEEEEEDDDEDGSFDDQGRRLPASLRRTASSASERSNGDFTQEDGSEVGPEKTPPPLAAAAEAAAAAPLSYDHTPNGKKEEGAVVPVSPPSQTPPLSGELGGNGVLEDGEEDMVLAAASALHNHQHYATITPGSPHITAPPVLPVGSADAAAGGVEASAAAPRGGDAGDLFQKSLGCFNLKVIFQHRRTGFEESKDFVAPRGEVIAGRYLVEDTLGQAAFSTALQCVDLHHQSNNDNGDGDSEPLSVCLKVIKNNKDFFDQSLDEIKLLHYLNGSGDPDRHHVLHMYDFFYYREHLFLVAELLRENLYEFGKFVRESGDAPYFTLSNLKKIGRQILEALDFVHGLGLIHCDVKPENIVIRSYSRCEVKLIDFGSSCFLTDQPTTYIQSRSYRAPEVILGLNYDGRIDLWSLGCVLAEQLTGYVLFQNDSVQTMLARIQGVLGPFPEKSLAEARDTAKYMTPNNIVYERVRVEPDEDDGGVGGERVAASPEAIEEFLAAQPPFDAENAAAQAEAEVVALPLDAVVDLGALADEFEDVEGEGEEEREQRWQDLVAGEARESRMGLMHQRFEQYEQGHHSEALAEATALAAQAAQQSAKAQQAGGGEQYQYLVVYPKHTTLRHRLHTSNRLFLDFVQFLLTIDHAARPTAREVIATLSSSFD